MTKKLKQCSKSSWALDFIYGLYGGGVTVYRCTHCKMLSYRKTGYCSYCGRQMDNADKTLIIETEDE